jgi:hypothetical protein
MGLIIGQLCLLELLRQPMVGFGNATVTFGKRYAFGVGTRGYCPLHVLSVVMIWPRQLGGYDEAAVVAHAVSMWSNTICCILP